MVVARRGRKRTYTIHEETIELVTFPVWEQQPLESIDWYERFKTWYLPVPSGYRTLNRAFSNCGEAAGETIEKTKFKRAKTVPDDWILACKNYRWEERARAYWLKKIQDQDGHIDHVLTEIRERTLKIAMKSLDKIEAMTNYPISRRTVTSVDESGRPIQLTIEPNGNWSHRDALSMSKTLTDVLEKVMGFDTLDYAINVIQKNGLAVIDPDGKLVGQEAIAPGVDDDIAAIVRDSAVVDDDVLIPTVITGEEEE
jgi:hypothetical protein